MLPVLIATALLANTPQEPWPPARYELIVSEDGDLPLDSKDNLPVIIGPATADIILRHRTEFSDAYNKVVIPPNLLKRWQEVEEPCTIVVVFGSWCADSYHWMPDLIKLSEIVNPFISIHWIGTYREKITNPCDWPSQSIYQKTERVPTFWLFVPTPGGGTKLAGSIVENPPKAGQTMAEALIELLETVL